MAEGDLAGSVINDAVFRPSNGDVAALMRARTYINGQQHHVFDSDTRPNADEAEGFISMAVALVLPRTGTSLGNNADLVAAARQLVAMLAASLIERSYWPEQASEQGSLAQLFEEQFGQGMVALLGAIGEHGDDYRNASISMGNAVLNAWADRDLGRGLQGGT